MADSEESPAQRQARLRREKREKKILEGGTARLEKITGVSGRSVALEPPSSPPKPQSKPESPPPPVSTQEARPALAPATPRPVVQTVRHAEAPDGSEQQQQEFLQQLQQMLSGISPPGNGPNATPFGTAGENGNDFPAELPPGLASFLSGGDNATQPPPRSAHLWRILHLIASVALGAYFLWAYAFTGTERHPRRHADLVTPYGGEVQASIDFSGLKKDRVTVFSLFASVELALQSARYLLADRSAEAAGMIGKIAGFVPEPWSGRLRLANQYLGIWTSFVGDAMVVIFVLGVGAWWGGAA